MKVILLFLQILNLAFGAKILSVFSTYSYSHYNAANRLLEELANRGHEVTLISPFKNEKSIKNYRQIHLDGMEKPYEAIADSQEQKFNLEMYASLPPYVANHMLNIVFLNGLNFTLNHPNFQNFLKENQKFDLIILEHFYNDPLKALCQHFNAPCMLLSPLYSTELINPVFGNSAPVSYVPSFHFGFPSKMTFIQRLCNSLFHVYEQFIYHFIYKPKQNELMHQHFPNAPHINELISNHDHIILINSHPSITYPFPMTPNMIEIGGFHVRPPKKLPENFQSFMDSAKDGVILFSLGTVSKSSEIPEEKLKDILTVFGKLKQKVIWKLEIDNVPGKPDNVMITKWVPQSDILAHPNLKLFITHGGLLSAIEAVYFAVPMIVIPIGGDQMYNAVMNAENKIAIKLNYFDLNEKSLGDAVKKVLSDETFRKNVQHRSKLMHDQPLNPLDTAVYWTEFMIRNKGAPHLRSSVLDLNWFTSSSLDVVLFITIVIALAIAIPVKLLCIILKKLKSCKTTSSKKNKLKRN